MGTENEEYEEVKEGNENTTTVEWERHWDDESGTYYWYDYNSGETTLVDPYAEYGYETEQAPGYQSDAYGEEGYTTQTDATADDAWEEYFDEETQQPYWYNSVTGESSWVVANETNEYS